MVFRWTGNGRGDGGRGYAEAGERTLVKGLRQGDPDAFAALFSLYRTRIYNYVARIVGNPEDAKDVTQEVFIKAFRKIPADGAGLALKPWLYRVATTTCIDHLRARRRRGEPSAITSEELPALGDPYEQGETNFLVQETLDRLSDRHRLVLLLKDVHGLRHEEIAAIMGVSRGATETLLFRARATFRRTFLDPGGVAPSRRSCPETRQTALAFIAGGAPPGERQRVLDHARTCRDCRKVVRRSKDAGFGLAILVPALAVPKALAWTSLAGGGAAGGAASLSAAAGGGLLAKIGSAATAKIAIVAAATVTVAGTGVAVEQTRKSARQPGAQTAAAVRGGTQSERRAASSALPQWSVRPQDPDDRQASRRRQPNGERTEARHGDTRVASSGDQDPADAPSKVANNNGNGNGDGQASANGSNGTLGLVGNDTTAGDQRASSPSGHNRDAAGQHRHPPTNPQRKGKSGSKSEASVRHHK
jgi:RNA polymerase sigma-70 factor (ECF subfamily)